RQKEFFKIPSTGLMGLFFLLSIFSSKEINGREHSSKIFEYLNHTLYCLQGKSIRSLIKFLVLRKLELYYGSG
ncbi:uncharacterized protein METZ01_LOCUS387362, partial [marine metagenome]